MSDSADRHDDFAPTAALLLAAIVKTLRGIRAAIAKMDGWEIMEPQNEPFWLPDAPALRGTRLSICKPDIYQLLV